MNGIFDRLVEIDDSTGKEIGPAPEEIRSEEWPDDEYDTYVWGVLRLLDGGAEADEIGAYLDQIVIHTIGLPWNDTAAMTAKHLKIGNRIAGLRSVS